MFGVMIKLTRLNNFVVCKFCRFVSGKILANFLTKVIAKVMIYFHRYQGTIMTYLLTLESSEKFAHFFLVTLYMKQVWNVSINSQLDTFNTNRYHICFTSEKLKYRNLTKFIAFLERKRLMGPNMLPHDIQLNCTNIIFVQPPMWKM